MRGEADEARAAFEVDFVVRVVADDCVARVEARDDAPRRVDFEHAADVGGEVRRPADVGEAEDGERRAVDYLRSDDGRLVRAVKAHEAGARLREDAELLEAPADLQAELRLRDAAAGLKAARAAAREEVPFGLNREVRVEVVCDAASRPDLPLDRGRVER